MDPRQLEMLAAIVDNGGLTEGANALGKSQPSVSRSLIQLEQRLGTPLFEPGRKPLFATDLGKALAEEGRRIIQSGRMASQIVQNHKLGLSGSVRIAGTPFFMDGVVAAMIASFQIEHNDFRIDQSYGYADDIISGIENRAVDLGVLPIRETEVPEGMEFIQVMKGRNVVACRIGHPLSRKPMVRLADLAEYPWIAPPANSPLYHDLRAALEGIGVQNFKVSFSGGTLSAVVNILAGSESLTVLPYSVVYHLKRRDRLSSLPIRIGDPDRHLGLLYKKGLDKEPSLRRLRSFITNEFNTMSQAITRHEQNEVWRRPT